MHPALHHIAQLPSMSKSVVYLLVAIMTNHQCFSAFRNHHHFPRFFSFQIFHLVYMMNFVFSVVTFMTAELAFIGFETTVNGSPAFCYDCYNLRLNILAFCCLNLIKFCKLAYLLPFFWYRMGFPIVFYQYGTCHKSSTVYTCVSKPVFLSSCIPSDN